MSTSPIVDANYRLQPADLEGAARQVVIANVSFQGLEAMTPVLHFAGQSKRLVLSPEQVREMVEITGTTLFPQWIGVPVVLKPETVQKQTTIHLKAATSNLRVRPMPVAITDDKRGWRLAFIVVASLLFLSTLYALLNASMLLPIIQQLRDNWLLR
jgi:hypothetical protein